MRSSACNRLASIDCQVRLTDQTTIFPFQCQGAGKGPVKSGVLSVQSERFQAAIQRAFTHAKMTGQFTARAFELLQRLRQLTQVIATAASLSRASQSSVFR